MSTYSEKFKDPKWQKKRLKIMERDSFCCQRCFTDKATLNVHHKYYQGDKDPWEYQDEALVTLCEECHTEQHKHKKKAEKEFIESIYNAGFFPKDLIVLAKGFNEIKNLPYDGQVMANSLKDVVLNEQAFLDIADKHWERLHKKLQKAKTKK